MAIRLRRALTYLVSELYQQAWNKDHFCYSQPFSLLPKEHYAYLVVDVGVLPMAEGRLIVISIVQVSFLKYLPFPHLSIAQLQGNVNSQSSLVGAAPALTLI